MAIPLPEHQWQTDGKFFCSGNDRISIRAVTYGPFPDGWPDRLDKDFDRIADAEFNAIRVYEMPTLKMLNLAEASGLKVFGGLDWQQNADFFRDPSRLSAAKVHLAETLKPIAKHPALAGIYVGNEIPTDLVRWMGPKKVLTALESLIDLGREIAPNILFAYANYPSTEYLEPSNADFTAFNVYLEEPDAYRNYLKRLHHIAGDRPVVISEFGIDSQRNGADQQADTLKWALEIAHEEETAGFTAYAWSDRWLNNGSVVDDWSFGLTDREGKSKPALTALASTFLNPPESLLRFSVIVCTRNGSDRIGKCLDAVIRMDCDFETIVVDDGSTDGTADLVEKLYPWVKLIRLDPSGLSTARNAGATEATGDILSFTDDDCEPDREWLTRLSRIFTHSDYAAVGGPNLPPAPKHWHEAVVCAAPGAPSHVMLDDEEAEHLPGCNIAVRKSAFDAINGFDPQFTTAGDDVDFCWRLQSAGFRLGFAPGAFVWHWRRPSIRQFLKQQIGYGKSERLLIAKHPDRFTKCGSAKWKGFIYGGGPVRVSGNDIIYHGPMGTAGYQSLQTRMQPLRDLPARFRKWRSILALHFVKCITPILRGWFRCSCIPCPKLPSIPKKSPTYEEWVIPDVPREVVLEQYIANGWQPCGPTEAWDLCKSDARLLVATEHGLNGQKQSLARSSRVLADNASL